MSMATLRAAPAQESLRVGDRLPVLKGQFLAGRDAELPRASSGKVALVAIGFTYQSRFPVEAWGSWYLSSRPRESRFAGWRGNRPRSPLVCRRRRRLSPEIFSTRRHLVYCYVLLPVHAAIFGGMPRKIAQRAQSGRE